MTVSTPSAPLVLVTGATGTNGRHVVNALLARGARVRAAVRNVETANLPAAAERVPFDFEQPDTLTAAFKDVDRLFLLTPFVEDPVALVAPTLAAAQAAGVQHVVRMSAAGADPESPLPLARHHAATEALTRDSGLGWTVLRPTFFQDNFVTFQAASITGENAFYGASQAGRTAYIDARDIADAAATILLNPEAHHGQTYELTGPEALSDAEVAHLISEAAGREIRYINLTPEQLAEGMKAQQTPDWIITSMVGLEAVKAQGWAEAVSPAVAEITGQPGRTLSAFIYDHASAFQA